MQVHSCAKTHFRKHRLTYPSHIPWSELYRDLEHFLQYLLHIQYHEPLVFWTWFTWISNFFEIKWNSFPHRAETILRNQENYLPGTTCQLISPRRGGRGVRDSLHLYMIRIFYIVQIYILRSTSVWQTMTLHIYYSELPWRTALFYIYV